MKIFNKINIDWKYLLVLSIVILSPVIYNLIRIFWVVEQGDNTLSMTHFSTYLQMFTEILGAFILIPLFTYKNEEYKQNTFTLFISILTMILVFMIISLIISLTLINPMAHLNPDEDKKLITKYIIFQGFTWVLILYEQYLLSDFIIEKKYNSSIVFCVLSLSLKLTTDILLLSSFSIIDANVATISISSFISTLTIVIVLSILQLLKMKNDDNLKFSKFSFSKLKTYYIRGVVPSIELLIRNLCYSLVTLQALLMLGTDDMNAYNMGGYIYWMVIFKITSIIDYYLISELANGEDGRISKLLFFAIVEGFIVLILGITLSSIYLPFLLQGEEFYRMAIMLSFINIPIMIFISTQSVFKMDLITKNKYIYLLIGTLVNLLFLYLPMIIIIYFTNIIIGFWSNVAIFGISCFIPCTTTVIFSFIINNEEGLENEN